MRNAAEQTTMRRSQCHFHVHLRTPSIHHDDEFTAHKKGPRDAQTTTRKFTAGNDHQWLVRATASRACMLFLNTRSSSIPGPLEWLADLADALAAVVIYPCA